MSKAPIQYSPTGINRHSRKYHLTEEDMLKLRERWLEDMRDVPSATMEQANPYFFNPYRRGIYYYQVNTLFLLGCNEWHSLFSIKNLLSDLMSSVVPRSYRYNGNLSISAWEAFKSKTNKRNRSNLNRAKDCIGKIQDNFFMMQRLGGSHPYGYKLHQVRASLDLKIVDSDYLSGGEFFYKLSTRDSQEEALPLRDLREFSSPDKFRLDNKKFCGIVLL